MIRLRTVPALVLSGALTGCAALDLDRVFALADLWPLLLVAVAGPTVLAGLTSTGARRLSLWLTAPLSALAWLVVVSATTLRPDAIGRVLPSAATLYDIGAALRHTWPDLLTTILPAPAQPSAMVAVSALVWLAASISAELVARTRSALAPAVPALVVWVLGLLFGVSGPGSSLPIAAGFVVLAAALAVLRQPSGSAPRRNARRYPAALAVVAVVTLTGALVGPRLPLRDREPFDLRRYITPAGQPLAAVSPLDQVATWLATPDLALFTAAAPDPLDWRIGSLDAFDGQTWTTTGRFVGTGGRVPGAGPTGRNTSVSTVVNVAGLTGLWLPAPESPTAVTGTPVLVDPQSGVMLSRSGLGPGLRYTVDSQLPEYDAAQLRSAVPADDAAARAALTLPEGLPSSIVDEARLATQGATFPAQQATRLETYLRATEANDPDAPPGHTYGHLTYFLTVSHRGTTEQFGTAFAVMARALGLPTRVVVGFGPGQRDPDGGWTVHGADALVWPEVDFAGVGWVPFFPTPVAGADGSRVAPAGATGSRQQVDDGLDATVNRQADSTGPNPGAGSGAPPRSGRTGWPLLLGVPAGLAVAYLGVVAVVPPLRRRRRRSTKDPTVRVAAAWTELLHALRGLRLGDLNAVTTHEVAAAAAARLYPQTRDHLYKLAALADTAAFSRLALADADADTAWRHLDTLAPAIRHATSRMARLQHRLHPGVLRN